MHKGCSMTVHAEWLKQLAHYKNKIKEETGADLELPPRSVIELGLEYLEITPGDKMVARVPFQKKFTNPVGTFQGGVLSACADDVFGPLAYVSSGKPCLTLSLNITFLKAFTEKMGECVIEAKILQKTKTFIFMRADIKSPQGDLIAHAESHVSIMREEHKKKDNE
jgi:uncharacterized protein (TIGR00369 family)